jgi:hypothetical protein
MKILDDSEALQPGERLEVVSRGKQAPFLVQIKSIAVWFRLSVMKIVAHFARDCANIDGAQRNLACMLDVSDENCLKLNYRARIWLGWNRHQRSQLLFLSVVFLFCLLNSNGPVRRLFTDSETIRDVQAELSAKFEFQITKLSGSFRLPGRKPFSRGRCEFSLDSTMQDVDEGAQIEVEAVSVSCCVCFFGIIAKKSFACLLTRRLDHCWDGSTTHFLTYALSHSNFCRSQGLFTTTRYFFKLIYLIFGGHAKYCSWFRLKAAWKSYMFRKMQRHLLLSHRWCGCAVPVAGR